MWTYAGVSTMKAGDLVRFKEGAVQKYSRFRADFPFVDGEEYRIAYVEEDNNMCGVVEKSGWGFSVGHIFLNDLVFIEAAPESKAPELVAGNIGDWHVLREYKWQGSYDDTLRNPDGEIVSHERPEWALLAILSAIRLDRMKHNTELRGKLSAYKVILDLIANDDTLTDVSEIKAIARKLNND
jgi:hypothetical protein